MSFWKDLGKKIMTHIEEAGESNQKFAPANSKFDAMLRMNEYAAKQELKQCAKTMTDEEWGMLTIVLDSNARFHQGERQKRAALLAELAQSLRSTGK